MDKYLRCLAQVFGAMLILGGFFNDESIYLFVGTLVVATFEVLSLYHRRNNNFWGILYVSAAVIFSCSYFFLTSSSDSLIQEVLGYEPELFPKTQTLLTALLIYEYIIYFLVVIFSFQILNGCVDLFPVIYDWWEYGIKESCEEMTIKIMNVFYPLVSLFALYGLYVSLFSTQVIEHKNVSPFSYEEPETKISLLKTKIYLISKYFDLLTFDENNNRCSNLTKSEGINYLVGRSFIYINKNNNEISIDRNRLVIPKGFKDKFEFFVNFGKVNNESSFRIISNERYKPKWEKYKCNSI